MPLTAMCNIPHLGCEILHRQGAAAGAHCLSVQGWIEIEIRSHTRNVERNCG
jgi:hypothetical protein